MKIEFFTDTNGRDIVIRQDEKFRILLETDTDIIHYIYDKINESYPDAFKVLQELYNSYYNFKWLSVRRFIKCNFSKLDEKDDVTIDNLLRLEFVQCPLRGECKHENIICFPKLNTQLSKREIEIVKLICEDLTDQQIADKLFLSYHTVSNHRRNILSKINAHNKAGIVAYAHKNNLI